ncbi:MAG: ATP-binding cassette domain-containing protein [Oscillospiraceae bacterium]
MIKVDRLSKTYDPRSKTANQALYDVSFTLPDTGFVCIVGPSGCGKTSLLNAIGGLDTFDGGRVSTENLENLRCGSRRTEAERNRSFGYIFQNYYLLPEYSAAYNVYLGLHSTLLSHGEKMERVMEALRAVDMERFSRRAVGQLSGGQQQRVAIARALVRRPRVIFADEPTGNLDEENTMNICALLRRISKSSLVVMVTHEERIARFFADRILTLSEGRLTDDSESWQRGGMAAGGATLYTGDFEESTLEAEGLSLRLLREEGAEPAKLTLLALKDRIIIKLDDSRTVSFGRAEEPPRLAEGSRPVLKLETLEQEDVGMSFEETAKQGKAGGGLTLPMLFREARHLLREKGVKRLGSWLFLVVLTVLTLLAVGDYLMISSLDPEDFITTDSHILEISIERGEATGTALGLKDLSDLYKDHLESSGLKFDYVPRAAASAEYTVSVFLQMDDLSEALSGFSYVPLEHLDESSLILGRLPERPDEIVVDRWVLRKLMEKEGIIQSGLSDVLDFLGAKLSYSKNNYSPTIVGICDCGEPAVFIGPTGLVCVGVLGSPVITLSELRAQFPGRYDGVSLSGESCLVVTNNAGMDYANRIGGIYSTGSARTYIIQDVITEDTYASIVVPDGETDELIRSMMSTRFFIYCEDKAAMKEFINAGLPEELSGKLQVLVTDKNSDDWAAYRSATSLRMGARQIVTATVIVLSLAMLYLLQRSRVQERIGMVAVYRLLGIPGRKLAAIFALEHLLMSLTSTLPAAVLTWLSVAVLSRMPSLSVSLLLPWYAAAAVYLGILLFCIAVSLLPLYRLLRLPPARLAARYDL